MRNPDNTTVVNVLPDRWTAQREANHLSFLQTDRSFAFSNYVICVPSIDPLCRNIIESKNQKTTIVTYDEFENLEKILLQRLTVAILTMWIEPNHCSQLAHVPRFSFSNELRSKFPFIPILGDLHHKSDPHKFVDWCINKYTPTALFAASCPHIVAPIATRYSIPFTIFPWRPRRYDLKTPARHRGKRIENLLLTKIAYSGPLSSTAHPRRTAAVKILTELLQEQIVHTPTLAPEQWIASLATHSLPVFYCSLNSQFSQHLLLPKILSTNLFIDSGVFHNKYLFPILPDSTSISAYDFNSLMSARNRSEVLDCLSDGPRLDPTRSAELNLAIQDLDDDSVNPPLNQQTSARWHYYKALSSPYIRLQQLERQSYYRLLALFDILQELHRLLVSKVKLIIYKFFSPIDILSRWLEPFVQFEPVYKLPTTSICHENFILTLVLDCFELEIADAESGKVSNVTRGSVRAETWMSLNTHIARSACFCHSSVSFPQEISKEISVKIIYCDSDKKSDF